MADGGNFPFCIEQVASLMHLTIRRHVADGVYVDCPFCRKSGKMKINYPRNIWRCNYCGRSGGMLHLYARARGISNSTAYHEIYDALIGDADVRSPLLPATAATCKQLPQSQHADEATIDRTLRALLRMLPLSNTHREKLRKRGLTDAQIDQQGYRSTPPYSLCRPLTERLLCQGYTVAGVPGFFQTTHGWTMNFCQLTAGILIPIWGYDGLLHGVQIRLDRPIPNSNDAAKPGTKYIWFSSSGKPSGVSSGSPLYFVGDRHARVVIVTEGALKAYLAHCFMERTFAAIPGANNTAQLGQFFADLSKNGTQLILEGLDMDKTTNPSVLHGARTIHELAHTHGLQCRSLLWPPEYKGIDDWQHSLQLQETRIVNTTVST